MTDNKPFFKELTQIAMFIMVYALVKQDKLDADKLNKAIKSENPEDGFNELRRQFKEMEKERNDRQ